MKTVNTNTRQFIRWLKTEEALWSDMTQLLDDRGEIPGWKHEDYIDDVRQQLDDVIRLDAPFVFTAEFLAEVDQEQVVDLLIDGRTITDIKHEKVVFIEQILNENTKEVVLLGSKINGESKMKTHDMVGLNAKEPGHEETQEIIEEVKVVCEALVESNVSVGEVAS